jgi:hypothetical protein
MLLEKKDEWRAFLTNFQQVDTLGVDGYSKADPGQVQKARVLLDKIEELLTPRHMDVGLVWIGRTNWHVDVSSSPHGPFEHARWGHVEPEQGCSFSMRLAPGDTIYILLNDGSRTHTSDRPGGPCVPGPPEHFVLNSNERELRLRDGTLKLTVESGWGRWSSERSEGDEQ